MNREANLAKNTFIITIGKTCTQLITFFLLPLYTGILSTEEYGVVDLLNTLVSLLLPIITLQVDQAIYRELIEVRDNESKKQKIISSGTATVFFQSALFLILFVCASPFIKNDYKIFLATNVVATIIVSLFQQIARGLGDNKRYAVGSFISAALTIVFNVLFLTVLRMGAYGMLLGTFLGQLFASIYLFISLHLHSYIRVRVYQKDVVKKLLKYSVPLIPNALSWWIISASDRVIVTAFLGVDQNGVLAAALKFSSIISGLINIFALSWTESIAIAINDADIEDYFNRMLNTVLSLFIAICVGMIACMPFVFPIMIDSAYSTGYGLVPISILATLFNVIVGLVSVIYIAKKNTRAVANTSIAAAVINIIVHMSTIWFIGLYAAVASSLVAFLAMSVFRIFDIRKKYLQVKISRKLIFKTIIIIAVILTTYYIDNLVLNLVSLTLAILFAWNINKDSFDMILEFVKKKLVARR